MCRPVHSWNAAKWLNIQKVSLSILLLVYGCRGRGIVCRSETCFFVILLFESGSSLLYNTYGCAACDLEHYCRNSCLYNLFVYQSNSNIKIPSFWNRRRAACRYPDYHTSSLSVTVVYPEHLQCSTVNDAVTL